MSTVGDLDMRAVLQLIQRCMIRKKAGNETTKLDVRLEDYVLLSGELNKKLGTVGEIFTFVSDHITKQIETLRALQQSNFAKHYTTVGTMMQHEVEIHCRSHDSRVENFEDVEEHFPGSRSILRLHQVWSFVTKCIAGIMRSKGEKVSGIVKNAYDETIGAFHPATLRKLVHVALLALPKRETFLSQVFGSEPDSSLKGIGLEIVAAAQLLYDAVQRKSVKHMMTGLSLM